MARSAQKQKRRPRSQPQVPPKKPKRRERPAYEQQMFFPRLIRQAKWVFVFLALVFAVGFVAFGVGGNIPGTGFGDILQGAGGGSAGPSAGEARDKIEENPNAYEDYLELRARDADVKRTVAGMYLSRANNARDEYANVYAQYQSQTGAGLFSPPQDSPFGRALGGKIDQEFQAIYSERLNEMNQRMQNAFGRAATLYSQIVATHPDDEALLQLQLGDSAYQARRIPLALNAYKAFLKLSPDDQNAAYARQQIAALEAGAGNVQPG
jgi:hypothetical protein